MPDGVAPEELVPEDVVPEDVMPEGVAALLREAYARPPRRYHTFAHATRVAAEAAALGGDRACLLAAWAHDVVYDPTRGDNEAASAAWVRRHLAEDPDAAEAARLVEVTAGHDPAPGDLQAEVLCDADLAVLGGDPADYEAYRVAVREEYAHVGAEGWRTGRAAVLRDLLHREVLYRTAAARARWEERARRNLQRELESLT